MHTTITFEAPARTVDASATLLQALLRLGNSLRERVAGLSIDARTRYLSGSSDGYDFERRIRAWDEHEERSAMFARLV